jgi:hypothetical protein
MCKNPFDLHSPIPPIHQCRSPPPWTPSKRAWTCGRWCGRWRGRWRSGTPGVDEADDALSEEAHNAAYDDEEEDRLARVLSAALPTTSTILTSTRLRPTAPTVLSAAPAVLSAAPVALSAATAATSTALPAATPPPPPPPPPPPAPPPPPPPPPPGPPPSEICVGHSPFRSCAFARQSM